MDALEGKQGQALVAKEARPATPTPCRGSSSRSGPCRGGTTSKLEDERLPKKCLIELMGSIAEAEAAASESQR